MLTLTNAVITGAVQGLSEFLPISSSAHIVFTTSILKILTGADYSIVNAEEAQSAINILSEEVGSITSDWKLRYQSNLDLLKKGTIADIAQIVRCLYNRSKVKELPILERKLYDQAKKLLQDEISIAMKRDPKEVEAEIMTKLEPPGAMLKVKHNPFDDEDEDDDLMSDVTDSKDKDEDDESDEIDDSDSDIDSQDDFDDDAEF